MLNYSDEPQTTIGNLRAALMILLDHHEQYDKYSEHMRSIGRGFDPSSEFSPEYARGIAMKALKDSENA